jgi:predicted RNA-binding protein with RPS1 domain
MPPPPQRQQQVPLEGSIEEGTVVRLEQYGAFVDLKNYYRVRGLIHISQLAKFKVERVEDVVAVDDSVWVKVLEVTSSQDEQGRTRHKVSLSLKDVTQDGTQTDLGAQAAHHQALSQQIQQNLQSSIGMGVAIDPMANNTQQHRNSDRLILKHQPKKHETVINGYALVDDDEGELPKPPPPPQQQQQQQLEGNPTVSAAANPHPTAVIARGRGRGTTLPAWMTRQQPEGEITAKTSPLLEGEESGSDRKRHSKRKHNDGDDKGKDKDNDDEVRKKRRKQHKEEKSRKHKHKKKHKHKRHRRSRSRSISSSSDKSGRPRDRSASRDRIRKSRRARSRDYSSRSSSSSSSSSRDHRHSRRRENKGVAIDRKEYRKSSSSQPFQSVEDAQRLIEQLEAKKQNRERERG